MPRRSWIQAPLLLLFIGCGPRLAVEPVYEAEAVIVKLRHTVDEGKKVPRGYSHPIIISDVRLAHILAQLEHEPEAGVREPSIPPHHVYELAEGLQQALGRATPEDEVIATAFIDERRLGIFTSERVTSFRAYGDGDLLVIEFFAIGERLEKDPRRIERRSYEVPAEPPIDTAGLRTLPGNGRTVRGRRGVAIDWRDPHFGRPVSLRGREGRARRRIVLMDDGGDPDAIPPGDAPPLPPGLSDAQLRALDQLEAARRAGLVTEVEFQRRHRLVVDGRLREAGYDTGNGIDD